MSVTPLTRVSVIYIPEQEQYVLNFFNRDVLSYTINFPTQEFINLTRHFVLSYEQQQNQPFPYDSYVYQPADN